MVAIAVPFTPFPPEKLAEIVTMCCEHQPWFADMDWAKGEAHRRTLVLSRLSDLYANTFEVYRDGQLVGILQLDEIVPQQDARCHFLFKDHSLADKRQLVLNMMQWAFESGYRRYEWKCDALNAASRAAAQRLGLSFEGIFRQAAVNKGRNRDTAWYAAIDGEWPALRQAFLPWLAPGNFDRAGQQRTRLSDLTRPILKEPR